MLPDFAADHGTQRWAMENVDVVGAATIQCWPDEIDGREMAPTKCCSVAMKIGGHRQILADKVLAAVRKCQIVLRIIIFKN